MWFADTDLVSLFSLPNPPDDQGQYHVLVEQVLEYIMTNIPDQDDQRQEWIRMFHMALVDVNTTEQQKNMVMKTNLRSTDKPASFLWNDLENEIGAHPDRADRFIAVLLRRLSSHAVTSASI